MSSKIIRRPYEKRARAAQEEATRDRIVEATIDLHRDLGPARTTVSAIAAHAGVQRATVYRHFPDERALFLGCSGAWAEQNPLPDPGSWEGIRDPIVRLAEALDSLYRWYEATEPMMSSVLRDADAVPIIGEIQAGRLEYMRQVEDGLVRGWGARGRTAGRLRAAIGLAIDFYAWRALNRRGLSRTDEIEVMTTAVRAAAAGT